MSFRSIVRLGSFNVSSETSYKLFILFFFSSFLFNIFFLPAIMKWCTARATISLQSTKLFTQEQTRSLRNPQSFSVSSLILFSLLSKNIIETLPYIIIIISMGWIFHSSKFIVHTLLNFITTQPEKQPARDTKHWSILEL